MPKQTGKVVEIGGQKRAEREHEMELMAEVLCKDEPSKEARVWADAQFAEDPAWRRYGDLTAEALELGLRKFWLGYATKKGVMLAAEALKAELGFAEASPVERLMIDHAVMCHARLGMVEHLYSRQTSARADVIEHWERRLTLAQKRFTRAVTALARTRALLARAEQAREAAERARAGRPLALVQQKAG